MMKIRRPSRYWLLGVSLALTISALATGAAYVKGSDVFGSLFVGASFVATTNIDSPIYTVNSPGDAWIDTIQTNSPSYIALDVGTFAETESGTPSNVAMLVDGQVNGAPYADPHSTIFLTSNFATRLTGIDYLGSIVTYGAHINSQIVYTVPAPAFADGDIGYFVQPAQYAYTLFDAIQVSRSADGTGTTFDVVLTSGGNVCTASFQCDSAEPVPGAEWVATGGDCTINPTQPIAISLATTANCTIAPTILGISIQAQQVIAP